MITAHFEGEDIVLSISLDKIHLNIDVPLTPEEVAEDSWEPYLVAEYVSNFPRLITVMASSPDHALQTVNDYICENEGGGADLLSVEPLTFDIHV